MANKMFLKLEGIRGESKSPRHFGEIEISGFTWGGSQIQQKFALGASQGERLTKNQKSDLTLSKAPDNISQFLLKACLSGKQFSEAVMTIETISESGNLLKFTTIKLRKVSITTFSNLNNLETITLNFENMEVGYTVTAP